MKDKQSLTLETSLVALFDHLGHIDVQLDHLHQCVATCFGVSQGNLNRLISGPEATLWLLFLDGMATPAEISTSYLATTLGVASPDPSRIAGINQALAAYHGFSVGAKQIHTQLAHTLDLLLESEFPISLANDLPHLTSALRVHLCGLLRALPPPYAPAVTVHAKAIAAAWTRFGPHVTKLSSEGASTGCRSPIPALAALELATNNA